MIGGAFGWMHGSRRLSKSTPVLEIVPLGTFRPELGAGLFTGGREGGDRVCLDLIIEMVGENRTGEGESESAKASEDGEVSPRDWLPGGSNTCLNFVTASLDSKAFIIMSAPKAPPCADAAGSEDDCFVDGSATV